MTFEHLKYFLAAASYLNFSKAADVVHVHQTTMTRAVAAIEQEIGGALFIRMKYSLQLTEIGMMLRDEATTIIAGYEKMMVKAKTAAGCVTGKLSLLAPSVYVPSLAAAYANFNAAYPKIIFSVDSCPYGKLDILCESILDKTVDMGIVFTQNIPENSSSLSFFKLYSDRQRLTVPLGHPLASEKKTRLSEMRNTVFLLGDHMGKTVLNQISSLINKGPESGNRIVYCAGETLLLQFSAGMGVTFMPTLIAESDNFTYIDIEDFDTAFDVFLAWDKTNTNPALISFLRILHEHPPEYKPLVQDC